MNVLKHVIQLRTPATIKHNPNVTVPLDIQLLILQEAKVYLIQNNLKALGRKTVFAVGTGITQQGSSDINGEIGLCHCISAVASKYRDKFKLQEWHHARRMITVFNIENAIRFGKARVGYSYWWEETLPYKNKPRRNVKPRLMFLEWCIRQTKNDMEKERKLLNSYLNGSKKTK